MSEAGGADEEGQGQGREVIPEPDPPATADYCHIHKFTLKICPTCNDEAAGGIGNGALNGLSGRIPTTTAGTWPTT
jgi:hypothetical protein